MKEGEKFIPVHVGIVIQKNCKEVPYTGEKTDTCKTGQQWKECDHVQLVQNSIETGENQCTKDGKIVERSLQL